MRPLDPQVAELCRRLKITDYLRARGVELIKTGNRTRCLCPMPDHKDHDPSCYIRTMPDGAEIFKCFGCGKSGNILTLMAAMEGKTKGQIVKKAAAQFGIILTGKADVKIEPLPDEVDTIFCEEQDLAGDLARFAVRFMQKNPTQDVINKVSRMYQMIDEMTRLGDAAGIQKYYGMLVNIIEEYCEKKPVDKRTKKG